MRKTALTALLLATQPVLSAIENNSFDGTNLKVFKLNNSTGLVTITNSTDGKALVRANKKDFDKKCDLTMKQEGSSLIVEVKKTGFFSSTECRVDFDIKVPSKTALQLENGVGDLEVLGVSAELDFKVGSGDVNVIAPVSRLKGESGSGSIKVAGLQGSANIATGNGNVTLSYTEPPQENSVSIVTGSGNAMLYLPENTKVHSNLEAGNGRIINEFGSSKEAKFNVSMKAGSGNLELKKLK